MGPSLRGILKSSTSTLVVANAPLAAILVIASVLRTWRLSQNGFGREYYAAGVRSMIGDWHNFFFNSFDPGGFVSLDKPPLAIWFQVLSAKLIGFNAMAILLPQVVEGLIAVLFVYMIVGRTFGRPAGLIAALLLALTPITASPSIAPTTRTAASSLYCWRRRGWPCAPPRRAVSGVFVWHWHWWALASTSRWGRH